MDALYLVGGMACLAYGTYDAIKEIKISSKGKQEKSGADIKILGADIGFIMIGVYLICRYI
jgi:hypothetical protein